MSKRNRIKNDVNHNVKKTKDNGAQYKAINSQVNYMQLGITVGILVGYLLGNVLGHPMIGGFAGGAVGVAVGLYLNIKKM